MNVAGLILDLAVWPYHDGFAVAQGACNIDVKHVALVANGIGSGQAEFQVPIDSVGHGGANNHFCPHPAHLANGFGEPLVVADVEAEAAYGGDIEHQKIVTAANTFFVGTKRKHLSIASNHLTLRFDYHGCVVDGATFFFIDAARN